MIGPRCPLLAAWLAIAVSAAAGAAAGPIDDYERLKEWRYGRPVELPAGGFTLEHEGASWILERGEVRLQEPTATGAITGAVFEGRGRFRMEVVDAVELDQLRRFANDPEMTAIDQSFTRLVVRTSEPELLEGLGSADAGGFEPNALARDRHDFWLRIRRLDADARVMSALLNAGERFVRVDVKTERSGWLTYDFTSRRQEEIRLEHFNRSYSFLEHWLSLDQPNERRASGRPGAFEGRDLDISHVDIGATLLRLGKDPGTSETSRHTITGDFVARVEYSATRDGLRALQFYLHPFARLLAVRDADGDELPFMRDHIGGRSGGIDKRIYDHSIIVLLPEPIAAGQPGTLEFEYEFEIRNYMPGRAWYPGVDTIDTALRDLHTARIEVTTREKYDVRAMGAPEAERTEDGLVTRAWRIEKPVKMVTFASARRVQERRLSDPELPEVTVFSTPYGANIEDRLGEIATDVQQSVAFFERILGVSLPTESLQTTLIQGSHGQAFDGFLHLAEDAAFRNRTGPVELFIAHEVAHQWAGHLIGWGSYRDQWLSEGMAQYLALLYMKENVEGGDELFLEAIQAHSDEITGSIKSRLSPFSRGSLPLDNKLAARRVGPIGHGYRAAVGEAPAAFLSQSYRKGALVLYMLHTLTRHATGGDQAFFDLLRDFFGTHTGGYPTTEDLAAAAARHAGGDWRWFFDQWVYRSDVPSYLWRARVSRAGDGHRIDLEVEQRGVPESFRMDVPVRVEFADGSEHDYLVEVARPAQTLILEVPNRPRKVTFNPDFSVLAKTRKR